MLFVEVWSLGRRGISRLCGAAGTLPRAHAIHGGRCDFSKNRLTLRPASWRLSRPRTVGNAHFCDEVAWTRRDLAARRAAMRAPQGPAFFRVVPLSMFGPWSDSVPAWAPRSRLLDFFRGRYPPVDTDVHSRAFPRLRRRRFGALAAWPRGRAGPQRPTGCRRGAAGRAGAGRRPRGSRGGPNGRSGKWAVSVSVCVTIRGADFFLQEFSE